MSGEAMAASRCCVLAATALVVLRAPHEHERHRDGDQSGQAADPQGRGEPAGEGSRGCVAVVNERVEARGGDGGGDRHSDGATELLRRADEPGGHSGVALGDPGEGADRDGDEGKCDADARHEERSCQVLPEVPVRRNPGGPQDAGSDESHPERP